MRENKRWMISIVFLRLKSIDRNDFSMLYLINPILFHVFSRRKSCFFFKHSAKVVLVRKSAAFGNSIDFECPFRKQLFCFLNPYVYQKLFRRCFVML